MKEKNEVYFEDMDMTIQEIIVELVADLVEKKRSGKNEKKEKSENE